VKAKNSGAIEAITYSELETYQNAAAVIHKQLTVNINVLHEGGEKYYTGAGLLARLPVNKVLIEITTDPPDQDLSIFHDEVKRLKHSQ